MSYLLVFVHTRVLPPASNMKAPESGASSATAAPAMEKTPKAAVPSEAQSLNPDIEIILRSRFVVTVMLSWFILSHPFPL